MDERLVNDEAIEIREHGREIVSVFSAVLARAVAAANAHRGDPTSGLSTPIRAEARAFPGLLSSLIEAVNDATDQLGMAASSARLDGVVRADDGYVAWGAVLLDRQGAGRTPVELASVPFVVDREDGIEVEIRVRRRRG